MGSSLKTAKLGLNSWVGSDKPQRADFNNDNNIVDLKLGSHIEDDQIHLTSIEKNLLSTYCFTGFYVGTGAFENFYKLNFTPKAVFIMEAQSGAVSYDPGNNKLRATFGMAIEGRASAGIEIVENGIQIYQQSGEVKDNLYTGLNKVGSYYIIIAFK